MHMMINISLNLLTEYWISINFIMKIIVYYLLIENSFINSNELLKLKNIDWSFDWTITK